MPPEKKIFIINARKVLRHLLKAMFELAEGSKPISFSIKISRED